MSGIIIATLIVGGVGLLIGILLGLAGKKFRVEVDEKEVAIASLLPGNNCGGCGYAGCSAMAKAIANGDAAPNGCPVGGQPVADKIADVLGVTADAVKNVAFVKCAGDCESAPKRSEYSGNIDCIQASMLPGGGDKGCTFGCLGYGTCVAACAFDAIHIVDGIAKVDKQKCVACGKCAKACPKHIIDLIPYEASHMVECNSKDKGKDVMSVCSKGCIGCKMCEKVCEAGAISVVDNIASIDYSKCTGCGECAKKCPKKIIK